METNVAKAIFSDTNTTVTYVNQVTYISFFKFVFPARPLGPEPRGLPLRQIDRPPKSHWRISNGTDTKMIRVIIIYHSAVLMFQKFPSVHIDIVWFRRLFIKKPVIHNIKGIRTTHVSKQSTQII